LLCILFLFYFVSPFVIKSVSKSIGLFSFGMIVCLLLLNKLNKSYISIILSISFYSLGLYYIFFTEYSQNSVYITFQYHKLMFVALGMSYIGYLVSSFEIMSFSTNDFLLLTIVIFFFFLPRSYDWIIHFRSIAVKWFLLVICIQLIFRSFKTKINVTLIPAIVALGLNSLISFFSFH
jgi:hypothetical protein